MSYLGNTSNYTHFESSGEQFSGTGAKTVFTLARRVANAFDLQATISNVVQDPFVAYSVAANTTSGTSDITFTSAPPSAANNIIVTYQTGQLNAWETVKAGDILPGAVGTTAIADGAITTAKIADGTVIAADIADGSVTNAKIDTVANTKITGVMTAAQIATIANTQITGVITNAQLANTTGSGAVVLTTSPTLVTPILGTPTSGTLTNCTGLPAAGVSGTALTLAGGDLTGGANFAKSTVASSSTPDVFATAVGNVINYTGTVTATGFTAAPQAGALRLLRCAAAAAFTAGSNMLIDGVPSGATVTMAANDKVLVFAFTTTQFVLTLMRDTIPSVVLTDGATVAVDMGVGNGDFSLTLGGNRTLGAPTNTSNNLTGKIELTQDGTGSRTLAYNAVWKFPGGIVPTLTTTAAAVDTLFYTVRDSTHIDSVVQKGFA